MRYKMSNVEMWMRTELGAYYGLVDEDGNELGDGYVEVTVDLLEKTIEHINHLEQRIRLLEAEEKIQ